MGCMWKDLTDVFCRMFFLLGIISLDPVVEPRGDGRGRGGLSAVEAIKSPFALRRATKKLWKTRLGSKARRHRKTATHQQRHPATHQQRHPAT